MFSRKLPAKKNTIRKLPKLTINVKWSLTNEIAQAEIQNQRELKSYGGGPHTKVVSFCVNKD